jgi:hypothetical protein
MLNPYQKAFNKFKKDCKREWAYSAFTLNDSPGITQQKVLRMFELFMNDIIKKSKCK